MNTFTFLRYFANTSAFFVLGITCAFAQVKVGSNPGTINGGSALEIEASDKGLLMPRVVLTNTTAWGLSGTAVAGMSVYNTSSVVGSTNAAYPATGVGEYYWDGTGWVSKKGGLSQLGADNGLMVGYNSVGNVGLGGALSKTTTVDQNGFNLNFTGSTATDLIGIGTASPAEKLHVYGGNQEIGGLENPILRLHSSTNAEGKGGQIAFSELDKSFGFYINHNTSSGTTYGQENLAIGARQPNQHDYDIAHPAISVIRNQYVGLGTANPLAKFHIDGAEDNVLSGTATAAQQVNDVVVTTGGLMGVGTTTPTRKLDINGDLRIQSTTTAPTGTTLVGLSIDPASGNVYRASPIGAASSQTLLLVKSSNDDAITTNNTFSKYVNITNEVYDPGNSWSNNQFTAPYTGKYILTTTGNFKVASNNTSNSIIIQISMFVNNTQRESYQGIVALPGSGATNINAAFSVSGSSILELNAGDIVDLRHLTYNNSALNIDSSRILSLRIEAIPN